jgi:chromosome segregation ATPase
MEQLTTLDIESGDNESTGRYLASLKSELMEEKATRKKAEAKVETLVWEISDLRITTDKFAAQVPALEEKVLDGLKELHAKELSLERTTKAIEDYKSQNARLTKKLISHPLCCLGLVFLLNIYYLPRFESQNLIPSLRR